MKVCAHYNLSPYQYVHERHDSIKEALSSFMDFRDKAWGGPGCYDGIYGDNPPTVAIAPQCSDCDSQMNFHGDDLSLWYQLGPRGGVQRLGWL